MDYFFFWMAIRLALILSVNTDIQYSNYNADVMQMFDSTYIANNKISSISIKTFDGKTQQYSSEFEFQYNEYNQLTQVTDFVHFINPVYDQFTYNDNHLLTNYYFINKDTIFNIEFFYNQNQQYSDIKTIKLIDEINRKYLHSHLHLLYDRNNNIIREYLTTLLKIPYTSTFLIPYKTQIDTAKNIYYTYGDKGYHKTIEYKNRKNKIREIHTYDTSIIMVKGPSDIKLIHIYDDKTLKKTKTIYTLLPNNKVSRICIYYNHFSNKPDSIITTINQIDVEKIYYSYNNQFQLVDVLVKGKNNKQKNRKKYFYNNGLLVQTEEFSSPKNLLSRDKYQYTQRNLK